MPSYSRYINACEGEGGPKHQRSWTELDSERDSLTVRKGRGYNPGVCRYPSEGRPPTVSGFRARELSESSLFGLAADPVAGV